MLYQMSYFRLLKELLLLFHKNIFKTRARTGHPDLGPANGGMLYHPDSYRESYFRLC
jgi:hypothetical protein